MLTINEIVFVLFSLLFVRIILPASILLGLGTWLSKKQTRMA